MKRTIALILSAVLMAGLLAGCGGTAAKKRTPEELTQLYTQAITDARDEETNQYNPVLNSSESQDFEMVMGVLGLTEADMTAYAVSISLMNVKAYGIAAIMPAEGREEAVTQALQTYIDNTRSSFEFYLPGPFEVASNARLETLTDGTVLMVMCEDQDTVFNAISAVITAE